MAARSPQPAFESRSGPLLVVLAIETRLQDVADRIAARETPGFAAHVQRLPAAIEFDHGGEYRAGIVREQLQIFQNRVGFGDLARVVVQRVDPLPRQPRDAPVLVLCRVGELAQSFRRPHPLGGRHPRLGVFRGKRKLDQRLLVADAGNRGAATIGIHRAARDVGAYRVVASFRGQQRFGAGGIRRAGEHFA